MDNCHLSCISCKHNHVCLFIYMKQSHPYCWRSTRDNVSYKKGDEVGKNEKGR